VSTVVRNTEGARSSTKTISLSPRHLVALSPRHRVTRSHTRILSSDLILPVAASVAFYLVLMAGYVAAFHGDLSALVCAAREVVGRPPYEQIDTGFDRNGYDGQFYYVLARAPWGSHALELDVPAVRHARVLYPAICWALSGGDARVLLWTMPLVNLLAIAALTALGAWAARWAGMNPWWGTLLPPTVNAGMPVLRNLTDVWSALSVAALLLVWLRRGPWWSAMLCAAAALLAREQNIAVVLLVLAFAGRRGDKRWIFGLIAAMSLWSVWLGVLRAFYGTWPLLPSDGHIGLPMSGLYYRCMHLTSEPAPIALFHVVCLTTLILQIGLASRLWWTPGDRLIRLTALAGAALALLGGIRLYGDSWSYPRVFTWLPLGVWFACIHLRWRWPLAALAAPALLPLAVLAQAWSGRF
jgi:hypothetical protein